MFDITIFGNPARLKREFLATTEVKTQSMGEELRQEFDSLKEESPRLHMGNNFWMDFVRTYQKHLTQLVIGRSVMTVLILVAVLASQWMLAETNTLSAAIWLLVLYTLVQLVLKVVNAWTALLQSQLFICVRTFVTLRMNVKLLRMGQINSDEFSTGNLKTLVSSDIYRIADLIHGVSRNGLPCLLGLVVLGPVIVYYMGVAGVVALIVSFGAMPLSFWLGKYVHKKEALIKKEEDTLATIIGEWVINVRLLRFLGWEALMQTRIASHVRKLVLEATKQHGVNLVNFGVSATWWLFPIIALIWANQTFGEQKPLVTLFASIWMLNHITLYIRFLPDLFISYAAASACVNRINRLFEARDIQDELLPASGLLTETTVPVKIHLTNVCFRYETGTGDVIRNLTLSIDLTERLSLIGKVGAGKSTLLKLVCAELKPTSGLIEIEYAVSVDAENSVEMATQQSDHFRANLWCEDVYRQFRQHIGYMPQEAYLSNTTLAVNVSLDTFHTEEDVMHAIHMAELEADIGHWASGLGEEIGETGVNLSGGQKQRVNLARALYSGRPYLVLDDPLSAVDTDTEGNLMQTLIKAPKGFLLSTHRLTELSQTDRLLVLDQGVVIEDGMPHELAEDRRTEFSRQLSAGEDKDD